MGIIGLLAGLAGLALGLGARRRTAVAPPTVTAQERDSADLTKRQTGSPGPS